MTTNSIFDWMESKGLGVDEKDEHGRTLMHLAAGEGRIDAMDWLVSQGMDVSDRADGGVAAMHQAAATGQVEAMKWLFLRGASIHVKSENGTAMHEAAAAGHVHVMKWLLSQGADVTLECRPVGMPMHRAAQGGHVEAMIWLVEQGADVNASMQKYGTTPMHLAAMMGHVEVMAWLVEQGADVNADDPTTPIHLAARGCHIEAVQWLAGHGAHLNDSDDLGRTPLCEVILRGCTDGDRVHTVTCLVELGADIHHTTESGATLMFFAACAGNVDVMKCLKEFGVGVDTSRHDGQTPMHAAASMGHVEAMKWLKEQGADVHATDDDGTTAMHRAIKQDRGEAIEWLKQQSLDVHAGRNSSRVSKKETLKINDKNYTENDVLNSNGLVDHTMDVYLNLMNGKTLQIRSDATKADLVFSSYRLSVEMSQPCIHLLTLRFWWPDVQGQQTLKFMAGLYAPDWVVQLIEELAGFMYDRYIEPGGDWSGIVKMDQMIHQACEKHEVLGDEVMMNHYFECR